MFKEDAHQKSSTWLHFYNCEAALKMLKIPPMFQTQPIVSLLIRESRQYQTCIFWLVCLFFDQVSMLTCKQVENTFKTIHRTQNLRKIHQIRLKFSLISTISKKSKIGVFQAIFDLFWAQYVQQMAPILFFSILSSLFLNF